MQVISERSGRTLYVDHNRTADSTLREWSIKRGYPDWYTFCQACGLTTAYTVMDHKVILNDTDGG